jgi:molybdenum cofactor cytidylyltransferase
MKQEIVNAKRSIGRVLCCTILRASGEKLLAKGHIVSEEDARMLQFEGMNEIKVIELEEGEVGEDDVAQQVACEFGCGALEIRRATGGRANLLTTEPSCVLVDPDLLWQINASASVAVATVFNFSYAPLGCRVATVKSAPFAVTKPEFDVLTSVLKERGPILQARPIRKPVVGILYTDLVDGQKAQHLFWKTMRQRLARFGACASFVRCAVEREGAVAQSLQDVLQLNPTAVLIASTTGVAGPGDVIAREMVRVGCRIERFMAPVFPGNLCLLGYKDEVPVVSAPGCFGSAQPNMMDWLLPPMLARYRISGQEIASLGNGGLLA